MDNKLFYKSKTFWTSLVGFVVTTLTAFLPLEYKEIIMSAEVLLMSVLTMVFRWNGSPQALGFKR